MNPTAIASAYRRMARMLTEEALHWDGLGRQQLTDRAHDLALHAAAFADIDPIVATATLDAAGEVWLQAHSRRGVYELTRMLAGSAR